MTYSVVLVSGVQQIDSVIDIYVYTHVYSLLFSRSFMSDSLETPWTVAPQAPLAVGFYRQEYWSGLPCPFPGDLSDSGTEPASPALAGRFFTTEPTRKRPSAQRG